MEAGECLRCGQPVRVETARGVDSYRCAGCGYEYSALASPSMDVVYAARRPSYSVKLGWGDGPAGVKQVFALRQLVPRLMEASVGDARSMLDGKPWWLLSNLSKRDMEELVKRAEALGLTTTIALMDDE